MSIFGCVRSEQHDCCCLPSETCGRNGTTPIIRSFHRTASSTTSDWSLWDILNVIFISFLALRSHFLELKETIIFLQGLFFYVYIFLQVHFACALCV